jgi:hypothetical protein
MEKYVNSHPAITPMTPLSMQLEASTHDNAMFVEDKMRKDTKVKMTEEFEKQIVDEIVSTSQGMFVIQSIASISNFHRS